MKPRLAKDAELSESPPPSELDDLSILLEEIRHEQLPDRLLSLAEQLQAALIAKRDGSHSKGD